MRWASWWPVASLVFALSLGCGDESTKLTQLVVVVDSDFRTPAELDGLQLAIEGIKEMRQLDVRLDEAEALPRSLGIVHSGGPLGPVRVTARGTLGGNVVVERMAEVFFQRDRTLKLELALLRVCEVGTVMCESGQTCVEGQCDTASVADLPAFDGKVRKFVDEEDAGMAGSGPDAAGSGGRGAGSGGAAAGGSGDAGVMAPGGNSAGPPPPTCIITSPASGTSVYAGDKVQLEGSCTDAAGGEVASVRWQSSLDGSLGSLGSLGMSGSLASTSLSVGTHQITLCALEPLEGSPHGCAPAVQIEVKALPDVSARIVTLQQGVASEGVYSGEAELIATGEAGGVPPFKYVWLDSYLGEIGRGSTTGRYFAPVLPGHHVLRLVVVDARGRRATAEREFDVNAAGYSTLFEPFTQINNFSGFYVTMTALGADGSYYYSGTQIGRVFRVAAGVAPAASGPLTTMAGSTIRDLFVHEDSRQIYLATGAGVEACANPAAADLPLGACSVVAFASQSTRCVRRLIANGTDYLLAGTAAGLYIAEVGDLQNANVRLSNAAFNGFAETSEALWLASTAGLYSYDLTKGLSGAPDAHSGSPTGLTTVAATLQDVWVGSGSGVARLHLDDGSWDAWDTSYEDTMFGRLVSNDVRTLAVTHPVIDEVAHDVLWIGTSTGLTRFDAAIPSFTTFTTAGSLSLTEMQRVVAVSGGLLLATDKGMALYHGE
jgi:hypothetical protein